MQIRIRIFFRFFQKCNRKANLNLFFSCFSKKWTFQFCFLRVFLNICIANLFFSFFHKVRGSPNCCSAFRPGAKNGSYFFFCQLSSPACAHQENKFPNNGWLARNTEIQKLHSPNNMKNSYIFSTFWSCFLFTFFCFFN